MSGWNPDDLAPLVIFVDARDRAEASITREVRALRQMGVPWSVIGAELGVTKQAAQQRYGKQADA